MTATQKTIRKAFGMDADMIKYYAVEISKILKEAKEMARGRKAVPEAIDQRIEKSPGKGNKDQGCV